MYSHKRYTHIGMRIQLADRDDELAAARAANRELMARINHEPKNW